MSRKKAIKSCSNTACILFSSPSWNKHPVREMTNLLCSKALNKNVKVNTTRKEDKRVDRIKQAEFRTLELKHLIYKLKRLKINQIESTLKYP